MDGQRLVIRWIAGFVPKTDCDKFKAESPSIYKLVSDSPRNLLLCPVRAYHLLLDRCKQENRVHPGSCVWPSSANLGGWVVTLVRDACRHAGLERPEKVGPHQFRKLAASYSKIFFGNSPRWEKLVSARMGSRTYTVIKKNYVGPADPLILSCVVPLGTVPIP